MTTIIGIQKPTYCMLVADSQVTTDDGRPFSHPEMVKISKVGKYLLAGAGDANACDIIQHTWKPPSPHSKKDIYHFMVSEVAPSLRSALKDADWFTNDKNSEDKSFDLLVAINGMIFQMDDSLTILMREDGIYGIGSGSSYAIGALQAGYTWQRAMIIAAKNDVYTSQPFQMVKQSKV